ncbi:T9SS type A sorting domain-containing protein [Mesonia aquimarina]|uniref:T9SS type A sorting domain-containing protein n=1 Tax=Mesonia aquimarina TaxID=1504967 RepID=UPI000EF5B5AB|nr:T9SS type A sorting domain-containing protein [Mesonia aquimarina]
MKKISILFILCGIFIANAQETTVNLSLQSNYSDEVYYKISTDQSEAYTATNWDLAFLRIDNINKAIRVNEGKGIEVYEASNTASDWASIDVNNIANFTQLHNSDTDWGIGALDNGSATWGWGEYNINGNHKVTGTIIFVLKYADGSFKKLFIEEYFGAYTFKYASWNETNSSWENETTTTVSNSSNPNQIFNYYNLETDSEVIASPATEDWDLVFKKYSTDVGGGMMYTVTGVLHHPNLTVAENIEPNGNGDTSNLSYSTDINTIGYDWKSFNGSAYDLDPELFYYVKYADGTIYRLHFTDFEGGSTGNLSFTTEDVTNALSTTVFDAENSFSIYPNPSTDKKITLLYENNSAENTQVAIYDMSGKKVFQQKLAPNGFYNKEINLASLESGAYILKYATGNFTTTKKLILN